MRIPLSTTIVLCLLSCTSGERTENAPPRRLEYLHWPITSLDPLAGDVLAVGLGPMARSFVIHPELSPDAGALADFARAAHGSGQPVHATAWIRDSPSKASPSPAAVEWPFVIVRLATDRDPNAPR